jgi:hypothetical protein
MSNKLKPTSESAGSRGLEVKFSGEDYYDISNIIDVASDINGLRPADNVYIAFKEYPVPQLSRGNSKFGLFRDFDCSSAFVSFSGNGKVLDTINLHVNDLANPARSVYIRYCKKDGKELFAMQDIYQSISGADQAYIKDIMYHILLQQEDVHSGDFSFTGLFEYFKLLHPERTETYEYVSESNVLLDGYIYEDPDFCLPQSAVNMSVEQWFSGDQLFNTFPDKTEIAVSTTTTMPILDSYAKAGGNLHMMISHRSLEAQIDKGDNIPTVVSATSASQVDRLPAQRYYGPNEGTLVRNLENIQAHNDTQSSEKFLQNISNAVNLFTK